MGPQAAVVARDAVAVVEQAVVAEDGAHGTVGGQHAAIVAAAVARAGVLVVLPGVVAAALAGQPLEAAARGGAVGAALIGAVPAAGGAMGLLGAEGVAGPAGLAGAGVVDAVRGGVAAGLGIGAAAPVFRIVITGPVILVVLGIIAAAFGLGHLAALGPLEAAARAVGAALIGTLPLAALAVGLLGAEGVAEIMGLAGSGVVDAVRGGVAAGPGVGAAGAVGGAVVTEPGVFVLIGIVAAAERARNLAADVPLEAAARGRAVGLRLVGVLPGDAVAVGFLSCRAEGMAGAGILTGPGMIHAVGGVIAAGLDVAAAGAVVRAVDAEQPILAEVIAAAGGPGDIAADIPLEVTAVTVAVGVIGILRRVEAGPRAAAQ